jgi:tRNA(fMet)-specific endonuclease VapC
MSEGSDAAPARLVVDTNIVSYLMKGHEIARLYAPHLQGKLLAISFITVGEMYFGAENANWGEPKRQLLEQRLRNFVVVPYDHEIARHYALVSVQRKRKGRPIALHDAWIAACALRHGVPLVTHNRKDFEDIDGLKVISEVAAA